MLLKSGYICLPGIAGRARAAMLSGLAVLVVSSSLCLQPVRPADSSQTPGAASAGSAAGEAREKSQSAPAQPPNVTIQVINLPPKKTEATNAAAPPERPRTGKGKKAKKTRRGTPPCLAWIDPDVEPKAVLLCVHGLGLYNGTYEPFGKRMAKLGIATYAIDMRGFGSWMEAKGRQRVDFEAALADVGAVLKVIHRAHPGLPVFLLGESMGGAIALQATALYPDLIDGVISSVPAGDRFQQKRTALKVALRLLANPNKPFDVGTQVIEQATEKPEVREAWSKDPLARINISPRELLQFQAFMNKNHAAARKIKATPVLIVQGCRDRLVRPEGTVELYNELATPDRQLVLVPSAEHLIFEEEQFNDEIVDLTVGWINGHLSRRAAGTPAVLNK
ncbi:MAG TPA: alpha/beta fold hydrolase [Candidatus Obscuribacterales bacterium]